MEKLVERVVSPVQRSVDPEKEALRMVLTVPLDRRDSTFYERLSELADEDPHTFSEEELDRRLEEGPMQ